MAHFAKLDSDNIVTQVVVVNNDILLENGTESEQKGIDFLTRLFGAATWKQTSYNGSIRKNYAGVGYKYDSAKDAFISPQPFASWTLNETTCTWESPVPMPTDGVYNWDDANQQWVLAKAFVTPSNV
jgi:hypothetical protein